MSSPSTELPLAAPSQIECRVLSVANLFAIGEFHPAPVQREYQWEATHCTRLLDDLVRTFEASRHSAERAPAATGGELPAKVGDAEEGGEDEDTLDLGNLPPSPPAEPATSPIYYLGAIVTHLAAPGIFHIFDGLQRITTLTIVLAILRDLAADADLKRRLDNAIVLDATATGARRRYRHNMRPLQVVLRQEVQPVGEALRRRRERRGLSAADVSVREATRVLLRIVRAWDSERRGAFADWLLEGVHIGLTEVGSARLGRQVFVSTNLQGKKLNQVDLFKGQLLDLASDDATAQQIANRWARIEADLGQSLHGFLVAIDFLTRCEPQGDDCLTHLAAHLEQTKDPDEIGKWLDYLMGMAAAWKELHEKLDWPGQHAPDPDIWRLGLFEWTEWKPLALLWYRQYLDRRNESGRVPERTWKAYTGRFKALHRRCMAMTLAGYSLSDRSLIIARAIRQATSGHNPLTGRGALTFSQGAQTKMVRTLVAPLHDGPVRSTIVRWLEASHWMHPPSYLAKATVEHVLPQNPAPGSSWPSEFPEDDDRFQYVHALGNLLPLDGARQPRAGNRDFADKAVIYRELPKFEMLHAALSEPNWNRDTIKRRKKALIRRVFEIMALPEERQT